MTNKLNRLKDYFGYSTSEKNGILILFVLLLIIIIINILLPFIIPTNKTDFSEFEERISLFEKRQTEIADSLNNLRLNRNTNSKKKASTFTPFYFDPNNMPVEEWKKLGLQDRQIEMIKKYESKGGKFYETDDLAKMYCISDEEFKILEPYIIIKSETDSSEIPNLKPFEFDPNTVSSEDLQRMHMREKLINSIINYRDKGGKFYNKTDLQKIYTISDQEYTILEPFIVIEKDTFQIEPKSIQLSDTFLVEINTADSLDLQQLKGIGPAFAKRIIKYKNLLGGYNNKDQLLEVYGMDNNRFDGIKDHVIINDSLITKININLASIKEMTKHPYIEFYVAKSIITYRNENGIYKDLEEIKNARLIYKELYQKIIPYLTTN